MKTICATITSPLRSSITVIRISGSQALKCLEKIGVKNQPIPQKSFFHKIIFDNDDELIDEAIITFLKHREALREKMSPKLAFTALNIF